MMNYSGVNLPDEVLAFLEVNSYSYIHRSLVADGIQSCLYKIFVIDNEGKKQYFALKEFRTSYSRNNKELVFREYEALLRFHNALNLRRDHQARAPKPISVFPNSLSYIMEFVTGETLKCKPVKSKDSADYVACLIANALVIYHDIENTIYGDFHSGNVMQDKNGVVMIDCTPPVDWSNELWAESLKEPKISLDVGYWVYCSICSVPRGIFTNPVILIRDLIFAAKIITSCSNLSNQKLKESINEIYFVTRMHLNKLMCSSLRGLVVGSAGVLGFIFVRSLITFGSKEKCNRWC